MQDVWYKLNLRVAQQPPSLYVHAPVSYLLPIFLYKISPDFGSSRLEVFCKKGVLEKFTKLTEKHLCHSLFFNKMSPSIYIAKHIANVSENYQEFQMCFSSN